MDKFFGFLYSITIKPLQDFMYSTRVHPTVKTIVCSAFWLLTSAVLALYTYVTWVSGDMLGGIILAIVTLVWFSMMLSCTILGHIRKWKND